MQAKAQAAITLAVTLFDVGPFCEKVDAERVATSVCNLNGPLAFPGVRVTAVAPELSGPRRASVGGGASSREAEVLETARK